MRLLRWFSPSPDRPVAERLYRAIVQQSRTPEFYQDLGVPDTPDGRFDTIAIHAVLVMRRLHDVPERTTNVSQALFDLFFADMDQNLREMGVGDLAVGKRIKAMAKNFYGRLAAIDKALGEVENDELRAVLQRNVYRHTVCTPLQLEAMAAYIRRESNRLRTIEIDEMLKNGVSFGVVATDGRLEETHGRPTQ